MMRAWISVAMAAAIAAAVSSPAWTASPFVRTLAELSTADREALPRAEREVLETMKPGAVSVWKDEKTGHSGEARLLRTYEQNGMACGEVQHVLKLRRESRLVMPLCRVSDGTWRLAF